MELVDENEGYYDEEVVDFLSGESLPEFTLSTQSTANKAASSANSRARLYEDKSETEENALDSSVKDHVRKGAELEI